MAGKLCCGCAAIGSHTSVEKTDDLPASWQSIAEAPSWLPSKRECGIVRCNLCRRFWYVSPHPREGEYRVSELPGHVENLLGERLAKVWRCVDSGEHSVRSLTMTWFANAVYDVKQAVEGLVRRIGEAGQSDDDILRLLVYLRHVSYGTSVQREWKTVRSSGGPVLRLANLKPLIAAARRGGSQHQKERIHDELISVAEGLLGQSFGCAVDIVGVAEHERNAFLVAIGKPECEERVRRRTKKSEQSAPVSSSGTGFSAKP